MRPWRGLRAAIGSVRAGLRAFRAGAHALLRRRELDRETSEEIAHFLEEAEADLVARGASREEARRAVRLRYGDPLPAREDVRAYGWEAGVETLLSDLRLTLRGLRRNPAFTTVVVLTLGLGVGATTAIVSAVRPVLFEPLAYPAADRLVSIADRGGDGTLLQTTFGTYRELDQRNRVFSGLAVFKPWEPTLTGDGEPTRLEGQSVSASYFDVLGVAPVLGPGLDASQDRPDGDRQVLISDALWRARFDADPELLGRAVRLDGEPAVVVGVMPGDFENVTAATASVWTLLQYDPMLPGFDTREWGRHLEMIGRLLPGVELDEAGSALQDIARRPIGEVVRPDWASMSGGFALRPLKEAVVEDVEPTLLVLLGAVLLLLGVTCANLTVVSLARGSRRKGEFSLRLALGAGRARLARYLVTEGLVLAALGGALGVMVAGIGLEALVRVAPPTLPRLGDVTLDGPAVLLALALTTLIGLMFGLAPGLHRGGVTVSALKDLGRRTARRTHTARRALIVSEVALATVLLIGAGLLLRSAQRLFSQPLGFDPSGVVVMQVHATGLESGDGVTHRFFDEALDAVEDVPGVASAALASQLPLSGGTDMYGAVPDAPDVVEGTLGPAQRYAVTPGYFDVLGVPVLRGRFLEVGDVAGAPRVAVVSRSLARRLFPDADALGRRVRVGPEELEPFTVVGVVEDVKHASLAGGPAEAVYVPTGQWHWADRVRWVVARGQGDATSLVPAIRRAIWSADGNQPVVRAQSMDAVVTRSEARRRFVLIVLSVFALSALAVSGVGLFGVLSGLVEERTREMGVRAALGASRENLVALVVRQGLGLVGLGTVIGAAGAASGSRALSGMLFEVSRFDSATYVGALVVVVSGAVLASAAPAIRAGRADPAEALRAE